MDSGPLAERTARMLEEIWTQGLSEFAYRNDLDLTGRVRFPTGAAAPPAPGQAPLSRRTAVPIGGGKDSLTTLEILREAGEPIVAFAVGSAPPIARTIAASGLPACTVTRRLAPELLALNAAGAWNGHVPISSILAFLTPVCAILYGFDAAAFSNERSANAPTLTSAWGPVNHQYSKSLAFERLASRYIRDHVLAGFDYFSFLRPLSELAITRSFTTWLDRYPEFSSCNRNFRQDRDGATPRWCLDCAKCRSTFLLLAPFNAPARLTGLFGGNLLADAAQVPHFRELLGLQGTKPFDCVAEDYEYQAALVMAARRTDWRDVITPDLRADAARVPDPDDAIARALAPSPDHELPPRFAAILDAHLRARG